MPINTQSTPQNSPERFNQATLVKKHVQVDLCAGPLSQVTDMPLQTLGHHCLFCQSGYISCTDSASNH